MGRIEGFKFSKLLYKAVLLTLLEVDRCKLED